MTALLLSPMESHKKIIPSFLICSIVITTGLCSTKSHNHHHHQPDSTTTDNHHQYITDGQGIVFDHRFFLNKLFSKYGNNGFMTFEGFEHLLENLGLGGIVIKDHDVAAHKGEDDNFRDYHKNHNHSDHSEVKSSHKREAPDSDRPPKIATDKLKYHSHSHESNHHHHHHHHHSHGHSHKHYENHRRVHAKPTEKATTTTEDSAQGHSAENDDFDDSHEHDEVSESETVPELLDNLTALIEGHEEMEMLKEETLKKTYLAIKNNKCLTATEILHAFNNPSGNSISPLGFLHLCPAIIYELDEDSCADAFVHKHPAENPIVSQSEVWLYACLAILVISLCGLLSVAVIPIMQKVFYQTLLQFFVGLAVGSLSGDALLHLLPHSLLEGQDSGDHDHGAESEGGNSEEIVVFKGLAALGGVYFFFLAERFLNIFTSYRKRNKGKKVPHKLLKFLKTPDEKKKMTVGEKLSQYKANSYENVIKKEEEEALQKLTLKGPEVMEKTYKPQEMTDKELEAYYSSRTSIQPEMVLLPDSIAQDAVYFKNVDDSQSYVVPMSDHNHHGHGHTHEVPKSISAVAWMVIMGDGLHNFCDGLAIGAAFTSGIAGGLSTTVAIFCHELPHELGDFAMLLKAGMSVKKALMYNALSSILCFIGMTLGIALGNVSSATTWIFAGIAGMFLYIALVDMLPVLGAAANEAGKNGTYLLAVQCLGIATGITIMLIIAIYEHDLKRLMK